MTGCLQILNSKQVNKVLEMYLDEVHDRVTTDAVNSCKFLDLVESNVVGCCLV